MNEIPSIMIYVISDWGPIKKYHMLIYNYHHNNVCLLAWHSIDWSINANLRYGCSQPWAIYKPPIEINIIIYVITLSYKCCYGHMSLCNLRIDHIRSLLSQVARGRFFHFIYNEKPVHRSRVHRCSSEMKFSHYIWLSGCTQLSHIDSLPIHYQKESSLY